MEDILSSIKRIIAEEGDAAASNVRSARRAPRPAPPAPRADPAFDADEILELSDQLPDASGHGRPDPGHPDLGHIAYEDVPMSAPAINHADSAEPMLSPKSAEASRGSLEALSRLVVKPVESGADTLEGMVREMIRPMLRDWLDAKLPVIVETMVAQEIARITQQPR